METDAYSDDYLNEHWIRQYAAKAGLSSAHPPFIAPLPDGELRRDSTQRPLLQRLQEKCMVLKEGNLKVIDAEYVVNSL